MGKSYAAHLACGNLAVRAIVRVSAANRGFHFINISAPSKGSFASAEAAAIR
jgi:hypothetical protein